MSWVNDLASELGVPAGAATLAVAMYAACVAAEKAARPMALKDIGRVLKDSSWSRSMRPSAIIEQMFDWTFGERHLSWKCVRRSASATILFVTAVCLFLFYRSGYFLYANSYDEPLELSADILAAFLADYLALWKTRWLLRSKIGGLNSLFVLILDAALSLTISCAFLWVGMFFVHFVNSTNMTFYQGITMSSDIVGYHLHHLFDPYFGVVTWYTPLMISTLLTSIWAALFLIASAVIKVASPLQRFTAWFFDVDRHPLKAVGVVSAALVMIGSLMWTGLRAMI